MTAAASLLAPVPWIARGQVRHTRLRPFVHAFAYPTWFLLLPMRVAAQTAAAGCAETPCALPRNRRGWVSFWDRDHGDGGSDSVAWLTGLLADAGIDDATGDLWLQTYPRVLGVAFKPVSFWYAQRHDGSLAAVVAEVNNTFGERHCYVLPAPAWGREISADKVFHVSPFCQVRGHYRFRFLRSGGDGVRPWRTVARIDHDDADGPLLRTSVSGDLQPLTAASLRAAVLVMPWLSLGVLWRIHWQALRLWLKKLPVHRKPPWLPHLPRPHRPRSLADSPPHD